MSEMINGICPACNGRRTTLWTGGIRLSQKWIDVVVNEFYPGFKCDNPQCHVVWFLFTFARVCKIGLPDQEMMT